MPWSRHRPLLLFAVLALSAMGWPEPRSVQPPTARPRPVRSSTATAANFGAVVVPPSSPPLSGPAPVPPPAPAAPPPVPPPPPAAPPSPAVGDPGGSRGAGWQADRGRQALGLVRYHWQKLGFSLTFEPARRGFYGLTNRNARTIEIFVRDGETVPFIARIIAHELGHAVDLTYNSDADHDRWKSQRGIPASTPWFGCNGCTDFRTPAGDFAEVFAWHLLHPTDFRSRMAPPPSDDQLRQLEPFFRD